jgi:hypothetical protein
MDAPLLDEALWAWKMFMCGAKRAAIILEMSFTIALMMLIGRKLVTS